MIFDRPEDLFEIKLRFNRRKEGYEKSFRQAITDTLRDGMRMIEETAKTVYMSGPRPNILAVREGTLRKSVYAEVFGPMTGNIIAIGVTGTKLWYGKLHEEGYLKPIYPREKKYMKWTHPDTGVVHFQKVTRGIPAQPFIRPSILDNISKIKSMLMNVPTRVL